MIPYARALADILRGSGPSVIDQMTANDRAIAELESMGYGKFSPQVVDLKMQNPMIYAMGTGPIQSVSRRGLFDLFRSQKAPTIIKPTPPPTLDLSPTSTFDSPPSPAPTSNLPAVVDPEMFRSAQSGSGRAIEALSKQLGSDPRDQQALAEILRRAEGFVNPELNRRQLLQSLAGAVARKVVGLGPMDVLKESVTPPKVVVDPVQIAAEAVEKWLLNSGPLGGRGQDRLKGWPTIVEAVRSKYGVMDLISGTNKNLNKVLEIVSEFTSVPVKELKAGKADKIIRELLLKYVSASDALISPGVFDEKSIKGKSFDEIHDRDGGDILVPMTRAKYFGLNVEGLDPNMEARLRKAFSFDYDETLADVYGKGLDASFSTLDRTKVRAGEYSLPLDVLREIYGDKLADHATRMKWPAPYTYGDPTTPKNWNEVAEFGVGRWPDIVRREKP